MTRTPILTLALLLPSVAPCQEAPPRAEAPPERAPFVFEAGEHDFDELVQRCARFLQYNVLLSEPEVAAAREQGPFRFEQPVVTDRDGCEELLSGLLWSRGLAVVPLDAGKGVFEVLSRQGRRAQEVVQRAVAAAPDEVLARPGLYRFVCVAVALRHLNPAQASNALRPLFAVGNAVDTVMAAPLGGDAAFVLRGPQPAVAAALRVLVDADAPPPEGTTSQLATRISALEQQNAELLERLARLEKRLQQDR